MSLSDLELLLALAESEAARRPDHDTYSLLPVLRDALHLGRLMEART
jgi:hypothetical protein